MEDPVEQQRELTETGDRDDVGRANKGQVRLSKAEVREHAGVVPARREDALAVGTQFDRLGGGAPGEGMQLPDVDPGLLEGGAHPIRSGIGADAAHERDVALALAARVEREVQGDPSHSLVGRVGIAVKRALADGDELQETIPRENELREAELLVGQCIRTGPAFPAATLNDS